MRRKPAPRKSARTYLAGLYSRLSKTASAGLRRLRGRANRAGPAHIAEDLAEFDYIEKEAHDILAAVARLRARDLSETMAGPTYLPEPSYAMEPEGMLEPMPETLMEYAPETMASAANQARGRRRRNAAGGRALRYLATYRHRDGSVSHRWFDDPKIPAMRREGLAASSVQQAITDGIAVGGMVEEYRGDLRIRQRWGTR